MRGYWKDRKFIETKEILDSDSIDAEYEEEREKAVYKIYYDEQGFCTYPDGTRYRGGL